MKLYKKKKFDGQIFFCYIGWYGFGRMLIEGLRTDSLMLGSIRISQLVGLLTFIAGVVFTIIMWRRANAEKIIAKNKMESLGISDYLMKKYAGKETKSQYRELDNHGLIKDLCGKLENKSMNIVEQIKFDMEYLEYTTYTNSDMADFYYIITEFKTYSDTTKPVVTLRNIKTGEEIKSRIISSKTYKTHPFGLYSILRIDELSYRNKRKLVNNEWTASDEMECVLDNYEVIKNE